MTKKTKGYKHYRNWHAFAIPIVEKFGTKVLLDQPKKFIEFWQQYLEVYEERVTKFSNIDFKNKNFRQKAISRLLNMTCKQKKKRQTSVELHENYIKFHVETKVSQRTKKKEKAAVINENDNLEIITKKVEKKKITEIAFASDITVSTVNRISNETKFLEEFARDYIDQIIENNNFILHNSSYGGKNFQHDKEPLESTKSTLQGTTNNAKNNNEKKYQENDGYSVSENDYQDKNKSALGDCQTSKGDCQSASAEFDPSIDNKKSQFQQKQTKESFTEEVDNFNDNHQNYHSTQSQHQKKGVLDSPRVTKLEGSCIGGVGGNEASQKRKFHFQHLALSNQLRHKLQEIANDLSTKILECNPRELSDMNRRLDTITKLIDTSRKLDLQPVYMLNQIAEGGFNRQKELQGAVVNDKSMIDNGQIVLEKVKEEEQVTSEDIEKDLKLIGSSLLLDTASNFKDELNIIDGEFEEQNENNKQ
jgi:hypothetical protein